MRTLFAILFVLTSYSFSQAQLDINYYLPKGNYDPKITTPKQFLGFEVGKWHLSHDLQVHYLKKLAEESDRIVLKEIGRKP